jgi:hypothetical protein
LTIPSHSPPTASLLEVNSPEDLIKSPPQFAEKWGIASTIGELVYDSLSTQIL